MEFKAIGYVKTHARKLPRHWSVSDVEGVLELLPEYVPGLRNIEVGQKIMVLFHFHKSPAFDESYFFQTPPNRNESRGVFSICSPVRPNPIGLSVVEVLDKKDHRITVKNIDMIDGTPILDIKPWITIEQDCPSS
jgi:tRNA (adenine37-N6)-methyltransferase